MVTSGMFQQQVDPKYQLWFSQENIEYIQQEVARRLLQEFTSYNEVTYDFAKQRLLSTFYEWNSPLTLNQLLELVICDLVEEIRTEIEWHTRFDNFDPLRLYTTESGITREEKVKLRPSRKFTFNMRY
jgi:hypothetical protein